MTNAQKFEEVFGLKIDKDYLDDICGCVDSKICASHNCGRCPAFHFWKREYKNDKNDKTE